MGRALGIFGEGDKSMDYESLRRTGGVVLPQFVREVMPPRGRRFWVTDEMVMTSKSRTGKVKPTFSIAVLARVFFAKSSDWVRYMDTRDEEGFYLDGELLTPTRSEAGSRIYTLADVEKMAHALLQNSRIDLMHFAATIQIIKSMAYLYRILPEADIAASTEFVAPAHPQIEGQEMIPGTETMQVWPYAQ